MARHPGRCPVQGVRRETKNKRWTRLVSDASLFDGSDVDVGQSADVAVVRVHAAGTSATALELMKGKDSPADRFTA